MSASRFTVRARSIVGLYRETTISGLPIDEVKADLDRLGINPTQSIAFAKRIASGRAENPAAKLLNKIEEAEAVETEIVDLEQESMQRILAALPEDLVKDTVETSEEQASAADLAETGKTDETASEEKGREEAKATPTRRRLGLLGVGGSLVGLAAGIAAFVIIRPDVLEQVKTLSWPGEKSSEVAAPVAAQAEAPLSDDIPLDEARGLPIESVPLPSAEELASFSPEDDVPAFASEAEQLSAADRGELASATAELASLASRERVAYQQGSTASAPSDDAREAAVRSEADGRAPSHVPAPRPELPDQASEAAVAAVAEPAQSEQEASAKLEAVSGASIGLPDNLIGVFVLDPDRAPTELNTLEQSRRDDRLAAKRGEASLRALGRKVVALIAFERNGERIEAAVIEAPRRQLQNATDAIVQSLAESGAVALDGFEQSPGLELLELPPTR